jgi:hypothetical protein
MVGRMVASEVDALVRARLQRALERMKRLLESDSDRCG